MIKEVKAMVPADGWWAIYQLNEEPWILKSKIACFAVVLKIFQMGSQHQEEIVGDCDQIVPIVGVAEFVDATEADNFLIAVHDDEITAAMQLAWIAEAKLRAERKAS